MKHEFLNKNSSNKSLLVFFGGWGSEPALFRNIVPASGCDLLLFYDYTDLSFDPSILEDYEDIRIAAWSLGVWVAATVLGEKNDTIVPKAAIALNGTIRPIDDSFGIPEAVFDGTIVNFSEVSYARFLRRMCGSRSMLAQYESIQRQRAVKELLQELSTLRDAIRQNPVPEHFRWNLVVVGEVDLIFPYQNQLRAWEETPCEKRAIAHYDSSIFEELLDTDSGLWTKI